MQDKLRRRLLKQAMRVVQPVDGAQKMRDRLARQEERAKLPKVDMGSALDRILHKQQLERDKHPRYLVEPIG